MIGEGQKTLTYSRQPHTVVQTPPKSSKSIRTSDNLPAMLGWYREKHKLSRKALGLILGATDRSIISWERLGIKPHRIYASRLAKLLRRDARSMAKAGIEPTQEMVDFIKQNIQKKPKLPPKIPQNIRQYVKDIRGFYD